VPARGHQPHSGADAKEEEVERRPSVLAARQMLHEASARSVPFLVLIQLFFSFFAHILFFHLSKRESITHRRWRRGDDAEACRSESQALNQRGARVAQ
jgi:hypothetical protein